MLLSPFIRSDGSNVDASVLSIRTEYDDVGRVRFVSSCSGDDGTGVVNQVEYEYDGWGNVAREYQEHNREVTDRGDYPNNPNLWSANVAYDYADGSDGYAEDGYFAAKYVRLGSVAYPRISDSVVARYVDYVYGAGINDMMSRPGTISTANAEARYTYLGAATVASEDYTNIDLKLDYSANNFAAWDRFGRVVDQLWNDYGEEPDVVRDHFAYSYNRTGTVAARNNVLNSALSESYVYDYADRLTSTTRGGAAYQSWTLDGLGNFASVTDQGSTKNRETNAANEITSITISDYDSMTPSYDAAGNMTWGPNPSGPTPAGYVYDAWNRLVLTGVSYDGGQTIINPPVARYAYDGLGRRIAKSASTSFPTQYYTTYYYDQAGQLLEARQQNYSVAESIDQYVWGPDGSPIVCLHDAGGKTGPWPNYEDIPDGDLNDGPWAWPTTVDYARYYTTDANHNVTGVIEALASGTNPILNMDRYVYTAYGSATLQNEDWSNSPSLPYTDGPLYAGYFYDASTGLYHTATRDYDPSLSAWLTRDPIGYEAGSNLYEYCGGGPTYRTDPSGLEPPIWNTTAFISLQEPYQSLGDIRKAAAIRQAGRDSIDAARTVLIDVPEASAQNAGRFSQGSLRSLAGGVGTILFGGSNVVGIPGTEGLAEDSMELARRGVDDMRSSLGFGGQYWGQTVAPPNVQPSSAAQFMEEVRNRPGVTPLVYQFSVGNETAGDVTWNLAQLLYGTKLGNWELRMGPTSRAPSANPSLYWHGTEAAVERASAEGLFAHGPGSGGKYWATTLSSRSKVTDFLIGGTQNVDSLVPLRLSSKGAFEAVYELTPQEAAQFSRAWGPNYSWNPYQWYKGAIGQYFYQAVPVTWGQRATELGRATIIRA